MAIGNTTEDNVSRPAGYSTNQPGDMSLEEDAAATDEKESEWKDPFPKHPDHGGEDPAAQQDSDLESATQAVAADSDESAPDLGGVLQQGLDSHADGIQREKVVDMCSQALQGFKGCKDIIEKSKEAAPQLYQSSIMMLKAMIEMAKMLGLGEQVEEQGGEPTLDDGAAQQGDEWKEVFPKHPDHGGEQKPEHAPSKEGSQPPKSESPIGQPIGKLSAKHTTKHVAKTPLPIGAVNAKGQKKTVDDKTGKVRFIDMKEGRVMGPSGVPVKPPKQG